MGRRRLGDEWRAARRLVTAPRPCWSAGAAQIPLLREALHDAGLPVEIVGLGGLLTTPEVVDVVATLRVLADHRSGPALVRLLTGARLAHRRPRSGRAVPTGPPAGPRTSSTPVGGRAAVGRRRR